MGLVQRIDAPGVCPNYPGLICHWTQAIEGWTLELRHLRAAFSGEGLPTALEVATPVRHLLIQDAIVQNFPFGVDVHGCDGCSVEVRDAIFQAGALAHPTAASLSTLHALRITGHGSSIQISNLRVIGYAVGLNVTGTTLDAADVVVEGCSTGVSLAMKESATVRRIAVRHCENGLRMAAAALDVGKAWVSDSAVGAVLIATSTLVLQDVSVTRSSTQGLAASSPEQHWTNVTLAEDSSTGAVIVGNRVDIVGSRFTSNQGLPGFTGQNGIGLATSTPVGTAFQVHGSVFEGNAAWGLLDLGSGSIDATGCYWGSPNGPQVRPVGSFQVPGQPGGDAVTPGVLYAPFLTAPPGPTTFSRTPSSDTSWPN